MLSRHGSGFRVAIRVRGEFGFICPMMYVSRQIGFSCRPTINLAGNLVEAQFRGASTD